jgi:hypothetical protein
MLLPLLGREAQLKIQRVCSPDKIDRVRVRVRVSVRVRVKVRVILIICMLL